MLTLSPSARLNIALVGLDHRNYRVRNIGNIYDAARRLREFGIPIYREASVYYVGHTDFLTGEYRRGEAWSAAFFAADVAGGLLKVQGHAVEVATLGFDMRSLTLQLYESRPGEIGRLNAYLPEKHRDYYWSSLPAATVAECPYTVTA